MGVHTAGFHLYKIIENANCNDKQSRGCPGVRNRGWDLLGVSEVFWILIVVVVLQRHESVRTHLFCTLQMAKVYYI